MVLICLVELAMIMDRLYGGVCYAGIDTDPELKYPKVSFCFQIRNLGIILSSNDRISTIA